MELVQDMGNSKLYKGANGMAALTRNYGNKDKTDKWAVTVAINGACKKLATRADFKRAYALAEEAIR